MANAKLQSLSMASAPTSAFNQGSVLQSLFLLVPLRRNDLVPLLRWVPGHWARKSPRCPSHGRGRQRTWPRVTTACDAKNPLRCSHDRWGPRTGSGGVCSVRPWKCLFKDTCTCGYHRPSRTLMLCQIHLHHSDFVSCHPNPVDPA